jgi:hypothetical protein
MVMPHQQRGRCLQRHIGLETDFSLVYTINENFSGIPVYDCFFSCKCFRNASANGGNIQYGYAMMQFSLDKTKMKSSKI